METKKLPDKTHTNGGAEPAPPYPIKHKHHDLLLLLKIPYIFWTFTKSDFFTFIVPNTCFGVLGALSESMLTSHEASSPPTLWPGLTTFLYRLTLALFFNWWTCLIFDLANQQSTESINEDKINKPWRPIPSGLVTQAQARAGMLVCIFMALALFHFLDVWDEGVLILLFTWIYHDPMYGGEQLVVRDGLNGLSYPLFNAASLKIMSGARTAFIQGAGLGIEEYQDVVGISRKGWIWGVMVGCIIFTTIHVQDLKDQAGDRLRGRRTVALVFGDGAARIALGTAVLCWTLICLVFWKGSATQATVFYSVATLVVGTVAAAVLASLWTRSDSKAWKFWCLWIITLYSLPLVSSVF